MGSLRTLNDGPPRTRQAAIVAALFSLFLVAFLLGGLYFGYRFITTLHRLATGPSAGESGSIITDNPITNIVVGFVADHLPTWQGQERINILLLGIDQRPDERGQPTRTDTMIIVTLDPLSKTAGMLSIPRDLWVPIPGHGEDKINTAHFWGEKNKPGGGPALAKRTVEYNFGISIQYYALVDFQSFEKLIDTLGGITIDVPRPLKDNQYPDENYGITRVYIPAGLQHMDARTLLRYARSRHADSDFGRLQRQQQVLLAAREQAIRLDLLPKLPSLLSTLWGVVKTDIPVGDILPLANLAKDVKGDQIVSRAIGERMVVDYYGDGTLLLPKRDEIHQVIQEVFFDSRLRQEAARIAVLNGTNTPGLATAVANDLISRGYTVVEVADADRSDYQETTVLRHTENPYTVGQLLGLLGVDRRNVRTVPATGDGIDITIILGQDARSP